jgi:eukaryotic-like serine/threonine-protein kinase
MAEHKYRVLKRLEAGGMAEVFVGEAVSVQGFRKRVAIKRVLPHLAQNESFIQMFLDEARLSARLNHANIVSVFDISAREDTYFLIMEYVDGANLKRLMDTLQKGGKRFPLGIAVHICMEACRGLSYAHELADESGTPLGIVHRDISPPNIMVTRRGEVKVGDFGLAKAGTQLSQTDPGVVKGKFSYLSPEAANGVTVDSRSDLFSLGIVLWEMLAGRRLFLGESDYATVKLIQKANIPRLSPLNREVDEAFEEILLKALARDPNHRFQTAREFGDALAGYLFSRQLKVTAYDIATLVTDATSEESVPTAAVRDDVSLIDKLIQEELDESVAIQEDALPARTPSGQPARDVGGLLEDPASWFNDDELGAKIASMRPKPNTSGWRESIAPAPRQAAEPSSVPLRDSELLLEPDSMPPSDPTELARAKPPAEAPRPPQAVAGPKPLANGAAAAHAPAKGGGKVIVFALVAAAALIAIWLGIKH